MRKPSILTAPAGLNTSRAARTRRKGPSLRSLRGCLCLAALLAVGRVGLEAEDWPRWRGPRADSTWRGPALPERWPDAGLSVCWRRPVGGGYAGPSVAEARVLVFDRRPPDEDTSEFERLTALDAATGNVLWAVETPVAYGDLDYGNGPRASPTIHEGLVYSWVPWGTCNAATCKTAPCVGARTS